MGSTHLTEPPRPAAEAARVISSFAENAVHFRPRRFTPHVGVWSPVGKAFLPHGTPHLSVGRKPEAHEEADAHEEMHADDAPPSPTATHHLMPLPQLGPSGAAGASGGASLRAKVRYFPRDKLRSSEQRIRKCKVGQMAIMQLARCVPPPTAAPAVP